MRTRMWPWWRKNSRNKEKGRRQVWKGITRCLAACLTRYKKINSMGKVLGAIGRENTDGPVVEPTQLGEGEIGPADLEGSSSEG